MKGIFYASSLLLVALAARAALPGDAAVGKRLHEANCTGCHDSTVYSRTNRSIRSLSGLEQQLDGCSHMVKKELSSAEKQHIIKYLNEQFYRFQFQ